MPRRVLTELLGMVTGLAVTLLLVALFGWGYPLGRETIRAVGVACAVAVAAVGVGPLCRAWALDRGRSS